MVKNKKSFLHLTIIVTITLVFTLVFCTGCFLTLGQDPYDDALDELIDASKNAEDKEKAAEQTEADSANQETAGEGETSKTEDTDNDEIGDDAPEDTSETEKKEAPAEEEAAAPAEPDPLAPIWKSSKLTKEQIEKIWLAYWDDPEADWIYSIADLIITDEMDETDLRILVDIILRINDDANFRLFGNTEFPCGSDIEGGFVVCTEEPLPIESGDVHVFVMKVAAEIPAANPDRFYTYSVVVDGDGDPGNNFQFNPPYNWDYFQNTDRWYELNWNPDFGIWTLDVADVAQNLYVAPSAARAIVMGNIITFFIPAAEFSTEQLTYRMTAFGHDGSYSPEVSCGDVSGADPTEPLTPISGEIIILEE